ncbi:MAG TPA: sigma-70 family RNA polymerase sigma factor [Gemmataceae bacterium]|nr:sigma-70 family RNA polymerase sigma factor [Gemmataceae bacterium]
MGTDRAGRRSAETAAPAASLPPTPFPVQLQPRLTLLYHFCRLQMPTIALDMTVCQRHLQRTFGVFVAKPGVDATWTHYLDNLYPIDWFLTAACLEGIERAWETLFAARAGRSDCLLMDALRARAARLYPRDEEKQDSAVNEFWGHLIIAEHDGSMPVLQRYDGQRPLVPWLIRVFQNWHISQLRRRAGTQALPEDDLALPLPELDGDPRWHEAFCLAAHECLSGLKDAELMILGLRLRYRLSQREVAAVLGKHEGNLSRQTDQLRDKCLEFISERLLDQGWTGGDLSVYVRTEMPGVLLDDPRLSVDRLAALLSAAGKSLPQDRKE